MKSRQIFSILIITVNLFIIACCTTDQSRIKSYYTRINSGKEFEKVSRTGPYADIVIELKTGRFVFWRGSSYLPYWETEKGRWFVDELFDRKGDGPEKRPDRVNTYSRVIIAEKEKDKVTICWRYLPEFSGNNPHKGVEAYKFAEEYFIVHSNGKVKRIARKGSPKIDEWNNPLNNITQTFSLSKKGLKNTVTERNDPVQEKEILPGHNEASKGFVLNPAGHWSFDESTGNNTYETISGQKCVISGDKSLWKKGISGSALHFDGYKSEVSLTAQYAPEINAEITLEAWVALGAYPWNWTPVIQQCYENPDSEGSSKENTGYSLGIDGYGYPGLKIRIGENWEELISDKILERRQWYHIAGTYSRETGQMKIYIDGREHGAKVVKPSDIIMSGDNIRIGKGIERKPIRPVRKNTFEAAYSFDGLIDEISIYNVALDESQIRQSYNRFNPGYAIIENPDMDPRILPSGENRHNFGAYYTNLKFYESWDNLWRFGDYPDVVVEFDSSPAKFIFWRGTGYIPMLVNEKEQWYSNEFNETWGTSGGQGCQEPMSDKESYTNHVRIIENTPARVVVQWRYPLIDVLHVKANFNEETGWSDWADWYYTIYPDGVAFKKMHLWTHGKRNHEWQESMVILGPDQHPEQVLETDPALMLTGLDGKTDTYSWVKGPPGNVNYRNKKIHIVNYRAEYNPFTIADILAGNVYGGEVTDYAVFPSWNHWPVAQMPSDGRYSIYPDRTAHSSLTHIYLPVFREDRGEQPFYEKIMIEGMSNKSPADLLPLSKSWFNPPVAVDNKGCSLPLYDKTQGAYIMTANSNKISFNLLAGPDSPVVNPCFVIKNWNKRNARITINGEIISPDKNLKQGSTFDTDGKEMKIIWIKTSKEGLTKIEIR